MDKFLDRILTTPAHIPLEELRYYRLTKIACGSAWILHFAFLIMFFLLNIEPLFYFQFLSLTLFSICIYFNEKRRYYLATAIGIGEVIVHQVLCVFLLGPEGGFQYFLFVAGLIPFLLPPGRIYFKVTLWTLSLLGFLAMKFVKPDFASSYSLGENLNSGIALLNIVSVFAIIGIMGWYYTKLIANTEAALKKEHDKSTSLLHNILPVTIAEKLKSEPGIIADKFDSVSVLFADIVGFTEMSQRFSPGELVNGLNRVFSEFDNLTEKYQLEKIKTIGDAYMVSGGLPGRDPNHLQKMANLAIEMQEKIKDFSIDTHSELQIRIGIHTGPAVAGVIGAKKFAYDLWGDTVNTASRMESHGVPGKINVTEAVRIKLKEHFKFESRGEIDVKGKGKIKSYFLSDM